MEPQFDLKNAATMPNFTIYGTLPSLNEYLAACGKNPRIGGSMKRKNMGIAIQWIRVSDVRNLKIEKPLIIHYVIYEPNRKRDHDNVFCMVSKCVQDALQETEIIKNDGWEQILNFTHDFYVDKENPRIEVYLEEVE